MKQSLYLKQLSCSCNFDTCSSNLFQKRTYKIFLPFTSSEHPPRFEGGSIKLNLARLESSQHFVSSSFTIQRSERLSRRWRRGRSISIHTTSPSLSPACFNLLILAESSRLKQFTRDARTRAGIRMETGNLFKSGLRTTSLLSTYLRYMMVWR